MKIQELLAKFKELLNDQAWVAFFCFMFFIGTATAIVGTGLLWMMMQ